MTALSLLCEIAFGDPPLTPNSTANWDDVTDDLRGRIWIKRGRNHELGEFEAGRMTLTLANHHRKYDPSYAAGTYYGDILPMVKIRLTVIWDDGTPPPIEYPRFTGYVESWTMRTGNGTAMYADLRCVDAFTYFSKIPIAAIAAPQEASSSRISRVLNATMPWGGTLWPALDRAIEIGDFDVQAMPVDDIALSHMQLVAKTEGGQLYMKANGDLRFEDQSFRAGVSSTAILSNDQAGTGVRYSELELSYDDSYIFNEIQTHRDQGLTTRVAQDQASMQQYFYRTRKQPELLYVTGTDADTVATELLNRYSEPRLRPERVVIDPAIGQRWGTVLGLDISDRISIVRQTLADTAHLTLDAFIEATEDSIGTEEGSAGPRAYTITLQLSPVDVGSPTVTLGSLSVWTDATLTSGWTNVAGYAAAGYWRDDERRVYVRGAVENGSVGSTIFTLGTGYIPSSTQFFPVYTPTGTGVVRVQNDGQVILQSGGTGHVDLGAIRFRTY